MATILQFWKILYYINIHLIFIIFSDFVAILDGGFALYAFVD